MNNVTLKLVETDNVKRDRFIKLAHKLESKYDNVNNQIKELEARLALLQVRRKSLIEATKKLLGRNSKYLIS